jgi:hypothetical protein
VELSGQLHAFTAFTLGKKLQVPIEKGAGRVPEPIFMLGKRNESPLSVINDIPQPFSL